MSRPLIALALAALALAGCGDPKSQFVGTYTGEAEMPKGFTDQLTNLGVKGGEKQAKMKLDIKADGTCTLVSDIEGAAVQRGDWTYDAGSKTVTLNVTSPFLTDKDIQDMKSKGMNDDMIQKSMKNPMVSEEVTDPKTLTFHFTMRDFQLKMIFKKS